jgi:hypothetical protein
MLPSHSRRARSRSSVAARSLTISSDGGGSVCSVAPRMSLIGRRPSSSFLKREGSSLLMREGSSFLIGRLLAPLVGSNVGDAPLLSKAYDAEQPKARQHVNARAHDGAKEHDEKEEQEKEQEKEQEQEEQQEEEEEEDSDEERAFRSTREWQLRTTLSFITRDAHLCNAALDDRTLHRALNHGPIPSPLLSSPFLSSDLLPPCRCAQPRSARRDARLHGGHEVPSRLTLCTPSNALFSPDGAVLCVLQVRGRL